MENTKSYGREALIEHLVQQFGLDQTRQFAYCLTQQGLSSQEITGCLRAILQEIVQEHPHRDVDFATWPKEPKQ